jgi:CheY-like chemotaxis protein
MDLNRKILLIDDDMDDAGLFKEALEEINPSTDFHYYHDGKEAIDALTNKHIPKPDLVLLDINMPSISGWDCLTRFKKSEYLAAIPIIMYTTSSQGKEKDMAINMGAIGFITKPYDYKNLKGLIASILNTPLENLPQALHQFKS